MSPVPDSTEVDPVGHRVILENEHIRILEVRNPTGEHISHHSHPPRVIVAVSPYRIRSYADDGETTIDRRPGEAIWVESEEHSAEVLIGPTHAIEIEIKSAR